MPANEVLDLIIKVALFFINATTVAFILRHDKQMAWAHGE